MALQHHLAHHDKGQLLAVQRYVQARRDLRAKVNLIHAQVALLSVEDTVIVRHHQTKAGREAVSADAGHCRDRKGEQLFVYAIQVFVKEERVL